MLVIGAGDAGALVVRELQRSSQLSLTPVGLLDDDATKQNQEIHGVPVIGYIKDLAEVSEQQPIDEVIFAIPSAPGRIVRMVNDVCRQKGIPSRTMPGIYELIGGRVSVSRLREVDITDLLRREPTQVNEAMIGDVLSNGNACSSPAPEVRSGRSSAARSPAGIPTNWSCWVTARTASLRPCWSCASVFPAAILHTGHCGREGCRTRFRPFSSEHGVQVVFHAAAHKHVPLMQTNVSEAVAQQRPWTRRTSWRPALSGNVERLVLLSTDKAICPANVYGRHETPGRNDRAGCGASHRCALLGCPLWQRAGKPRQRHPAVQAPDRRRADRCRSRIRTWSAIS